MAELDLASVAFPQLGEARIASIAKCAEATLEHYPEGTALFRVGDRNLKFFVVNTGTIEVVDESGDAPRTVVVHGPGEFSGDVSHLTGNPAVLSGYARGECSCFEISSENLHAVLNRCPDLGDIILQAFIARRQLLREPGNFTGLRVIGSRYSKDTFRIRDFMARNRVMFTWLDLENDPAVAVLLKRFEVTERETPIVICGRMVMMRNPTNRELADHIGIRRPLEQVVYDLAIVGGGPAGLAAAVYGASEGLNTVVLERSAPGGQAGSSMRIENYLGFPTGITGNELANRAVLQAGKFGAMMSIPSQVSSLTFENAYAVLNLEDGEKVVAKCLLVATGAAYRRLEVEGGERFDGCGVYYAATPNEMQMCKGSTVIVVGGGNSAGQAAVFLSGHAKKVSIVIRGDDLGKQMSSYLVQRIEQTANIEVLHHTQIKTMTGEGHLAEVVLVNLQTNELHTIATPAVFSFIGADPRTDWLPEAVETDDRGFVKTGPSLAGSPHWHAKRSPFLLETSRPGVFAAGDVRSGSVKRVASAVGEGAMSVQFVHEYLKDM